MTEMEKVIKGLKSLHKRLLDATAQDKIAMLDANMVSDALALLKAQEPVEPQKMLNGLWAYERCGACEKPLYERGFAYCPWCGRKVKWDG